MQLKKEHLQSLKYGYESSASKRSLMATQLQSGEIDQVLKEEADKVEHEIGNRQNQEPVRAMVSCITLFNHV